MPDTQNILDAKITYLPNIRRSDVFETIPLKQALRDIKKGAYKNLVDAAQFELLIGNDDGYKTLKNKLPSYCFQGTFTDKVANAGFDTFSGLVGVDVDDLSPTDLASAKIAFANDECCAYAFVSPSGSGIKAAIRVADNVVLDDASFKVAFSRVERRLADKGITIDKSGKDVRRISFAAYDPQLFYRKHPKIFELDGVLLTGKPLVGEVVEEDGYTPITAEDAYVSREGVVYADDDAQVCFEQITAILADAVQGERHLARGKAGKLAGGYIAAGRITEEAALDALREASDGIASGGETTRIEWDTVVSALEKGKLSPLYAPHFRKSVKEVVTQSQGAEEKAARLLAKCDNITALVTDVAPKLWRLSSKNVDLEKKFTKGLRDRYAELSNGGNLSQSEALRALKMRHSNKPMQTLTEATKSLSKDESGKFMSDIGNVKIALDCPVFCEMAIGLDTFSDSIMFHRGDGQWQEFKDVNYTDLKLTLSNRGFHEVSTERIRELVHKVAHENVFDSAQIWLNSLEWDGEARVEKFLKKYIGAGDNAYHTAVSRYLWTSMAGRILSPGCKADMCVVLSGGQGTRKSTSVSSLVPSLDFFCEFGFSEKDDDLSRKFRGKMVAEFAELKGLNSKDDEHIKAFIVRQHELWTPKYKEFTTTFPRRVVLIGTTNQPHFLTDPTGNRRYLPVTVGVIDTDAIVDDRDQLWAEAAILFAKNGVDYMDAERLAKNEHARYTVNDDWEGAVEQWLESDDDIDSMDTSKGVTSMEILGGALRVPPKECGQVNKRRITTIMHGLGYTCKQGFRDKIRGWYWHKKPGHVAEVSFEDLM